MSYSCHFHTSLLDLAERKLGLFLPAGFMRAHPAGKAGAPPHKILALVKAHPDHTPEGKARMGPGAGVGLHRKTALYRFACDIWPNPPEKHAP